MSNTTKIAPGDIKRAFAWNMIASTLAAGQSAIFLIFVTRLIGLEGAGIFTLAYSIAQMMQTVGLFDMRSFQVTDIKKSIDFGSYFASRILTCVAMLAVSFIYIGVKHYSGYKATIILLVCIFKSIDAMEDVFHGLFQREGHLELAAKVQTIRYVVVMVVFALSLVWFKNLQVTLIMTIFVSLSVMLVNLVFVKRFDEWHPKWQLSPLLRLFGACLPLFIGSYLSLYIENAPKVSIDVYLTSIDQAKYGIVAMMAFVVNLFSGFAFRPLLTPLAVRWHNQDYSGYLKILKKLLMWILALLVMCEIGGGFLGIPVLSFVYGEDLSGMKMVLMLVILGGGLNSVGTIMYHVLTVMRKQRWLLVGYGITAIVAFFIAPYLVSHFGLVGAAITLIIDSTVKAIIFVSIFIVFWKKRQQ